MAKTFDVWRHHKQVGKQFTYRQLKMWMLENMPSGYHREIMSARHTTTLAWIASCSEYCHVKVTPAESNKSTIE